MLSEMETCNSLSTVHTDDDPMVAIAAAIPSPLSTASISIRTAAPHLTVKDQVGV